jgi:hypothetical protein
MEQLVIGVVLTALLGGLLVPSIKTSLDRRRERFDTSSDLLETLAASLWMYWELAMRVAYYGGKGPDRREEFEAALRAWDSDEAWTNAGQIQIQVSRARRLLPDSIYPGFDAAQRAAVDSLDKQVEDMRENLDRAASKRFYMELWGSKRKEIDDILLLLTQHLDRQQRLRFVRMWMAKTKPLSNFKTEQAGSERFDDGRPGIAAAAVSGEDDAQSELAPDG